MRLTSIELHPQNSSEVHVLSFRDPKRANPFNVTGIEGLDAADIMARYYGVSGTTGARFYELSVQDREIVMTVKLNPSYTLLQGYSDLRDTLYRMVSSSRTGLVQIQFKNETLVVAALWAWITKIEAPLFEKTQEVKLTFKPKDPVLSALEPVNVDVVPLDPDLTNISDTLSTAWHGFSFDLTLVTNVDDIAISDPNDDSWAFQVIPAGGFLTGDFFHFSSERNNKELYVIRDEEVIYLGDVLVPGSVWPLIFPGDNLFTFTNPDTVSWTNISYYPTYWGV